MFSNLFLTFVNQSIHDYGHERTYPDKDLYNTFFESDQYLPGEVFPPNLEPIGGGDDPDIDW